MDLKSSPDVMDAILWMAILTAMIILGLWLYKVMRFRNLRDDHSWAERYDQEFRFETPKEEVKKARERLIRDGMIQDAAMPNAATRKKENNEESESR